VSPDFCFVNIVTTAQKVTAALLFGVRNLNKEKLARRTCNFPVQVDVYKFFYTSFLSVC